MNRLQGQRLIGFRIAAFALIALLSATHMLAQSGFDLFQQAIMKERAEGNIEGAMAILERVTKEFASDHALVAKALLQLGIYSEKLRKVQANQYYDRLIANYPDQKSEVSQAQQRRAALSPSHVTNQLVVRKLWQDPLWDASNAAISLDGMHLAFVDSGKALTIRNLKTGVNRSISRRQEGLAESPAISPDLNYVAYSWDNLAESRHELRITDLKGTESRVLLASADLRYRPKGWSPDGKLLVVASDKGGRTQIATVDVSTGSIHQVKTFLGPQEPQNLMLSPDGRFAAYDFPAAGENLRNIFVLSTDGIEEFAVGQHAADVAVLGWPDGKWLLFAGDHNSSRGIWAQETSKGKPTTLAPLLVSPLRKEDEGMRAFGTTRTGSLVFSAGLLSREIRILEGVLPELARLQVTALQQPPQQNTASIEGVVVKLGSNEPISGADVELTRLEGTESSPLAPGAAAAFEAAFRSPPQITSLQPPAELTALQPEVRWVHTGSDGRFVFRNLKPGRYRVVSARDGGAYNPAEYGQRDPRGRGVLLPLAQGQSARDLRLEMAPTGVITGRVVDGDGAPVERASVRAAEVVYVDGKRTLRTQQVVMTDERGDYRLFWLPPGVYYVAVKPEHPERNTIPVLVTSPGATGGMLQLEQVLITRRVLPNSNVVDEIHQMVYFGNTVDAARARPIDLRSGGTFAAADVSIEVGRMQSTHIQGTMVNITTGKAAPGMTVRAISLDSSPNRRVSLATTDVNGMFEIPGISSGRYLLTTPFVRESVAGAASPGVVLETIATAIVEVGSTDLTNVSLVLAPPTAVPGKITKEGRPASESEFRKIRVALSRDPSFGVPAAAPPTVASRQGVVDGVGAFTIWAQPSDFRVSVEGLPPNTYVKSVRLGGKDVLAGGLRVDGTNSNSLEVVLADATAEVSGKVLDTRLVPVSNALAVLVPDAPELRARADLSFATTTDTTGAFRFRAVPPGNYKLFSWSYVEPGIWLNSEFLKIYESAGTSIDVGQVAKNGIQVTLIPRREGSQQ